MAIQFTPEDGTGLVNATSYAAIALADQYFEDTGRKDAWKAFAAGDRQAALNAATQYMDENYGGRYLGDVQETTKATQALLWPRENVPNDRGDFYPVAPLPAPLARSCAEFAIAFLVNGMNPYGSDQGNTPVVTEKAVRVEGAVSKSEKFANGGRAPRRRRYPKAEAVLAALIERSAGRLLLRA